MSKKVVGGLILLVIVSILMASAIVVDHEYPKQSEYPWGESPTISVYVEDGYRRSDVIASLSYWGEGGNGRLNYTPAFIITYKEDGADIVIRWTDEIEGAAAGECLILNRGDRFLYA